MKAWDYEEKDVLLITHKGQEQVARIVSFVDSMDNATPLYVNLRVSGGLRWGERAIKIQPEQVIKPLPNWYQEQQATFDASIKEAADRAYARMTPAEKERLREQEKKRARRFWLDAMIDRACGIE